MNNKNIHLYLTNRYLHGYQFDEKEYDDIKEYLFAEIKGRINGKKLRDLLRHTLGEFNEITADLYCDLAVKYLKHKSHRMPTMEALYDII